MQFIMAKAAAKNEEYKLFEADALDAERFALRSDPTSP